MVRRERAHLGTQLALFDGLNGWRHTAFISDTTGDRAAIEALHRRSGVGWEASG